MNGIGYLLNQQNKEACQTIFPVAFVKQAIGFILIEWKSKDEIGPVKAQQRWLPLSPLNLIIVLKKLFDQILKLIQARLYPNIQGLLGQY